jgi:hypothetical protein
MKTQQFYCVCKVNRWGKFTPVAMFPDSKEAHLYIDQSDDFLIIRPADINYDEQLVGAKP